MAQAPDPRLDLTRRSRGAWSGRRLLLACRVLQHSYAFHCDERTASDHLVEDREQSVNMRLIVDDFNQRRVDRWTTQSSWPCESHCWRQSPRRRAPPSLRRSLLLGVRSRIARARDVWCHLSDSPRKRRARKLIAVKHAHVQLPTSEPQPRGSSSSPTSRPSDRPTLSRQDSGRLPSERSPQTDA